MIGDMEDTAESFTTVTNRKTSNPAASGLKLDRTSAAYKRMTESAAAARAGQGISTKGMSKAQLIAAFNK